jgi:hypothetical protein
MFQRSSFKIFISTHSLIKHIQCIKRQYIIPSKTHTEKLKMLDALAGTTHLQVPRCKGVVLNKYIYNI